MTVTEHSTSWDGDQPYSPQKTSKFNLLVLACFLFAISFAAVTSDSLWIDEGLSAYHAKALTAPLMWKSLLAEGNSNLQLPLYHFYLWAWAQGFGTSEFALRSANIPLLFIVFGAFVYLLHNHKTALNWSVLVLGSNAMLWAYLDESRPYLMILGAASWAMAAALKPLIYQQKSNRDEFDRRNTRVLLLSLLWLSACSMLALPWCLTIFLAWLIATQPNFFKLLFNVWPTALLCLLLLCGILLYYSWTVSLGARASQGQTTVMTMGFAVYENLGFSGFGPSRQDLRTDPMGSLVGYAGLLALPLIASILGLWLILKAISNQANLSRRVLFPFIIIVLAFFIIHLLGIIGDVRILGRHVIPILLAWSLFLGLALADVCQSDKHWTKLAGATIVAVFLGSSLMYRFGSTHEKDNYRDAALWALAKAGEGKVVLWAADTLTGKYYNLASQPTEPGQIILIRSADVFDTNEISAIALSKPDIYDRSGQISQFILKKGFTLDAELKSFGLWIKPKGD